MGNFLQNNKNNILALVTIPIAALALSACGSGSESFEAEQYLTPPAESYQYTRNAQDVHVDIDRSFQDGRMFSVYTSNFSSRGGGGGGMYDPTMVISECQSSTRLDIIQTSGFLDRGMGGSISVATNAPECADGKLTAEDFPDNP